jgi:predicted DNA-binding transcriptional regulator AlpA
MATKEPDYTQGLCREKERFEITAVKTSEWYRFQREGKAPLPIKIGKRSVGWLRSELAHWIAQQAAKRGRQS